MVGSWERLSAVSSRVDSYSGHQTCLCSQEGGDGTGGRHWAERERRGAALTPHVWCDKEHPGKVSWVSYLSNTSPKTLWDISLQVGKKGGQNLSYVCLSEGLTLQEGIQQKVYSLCKTWFLSIQHILVQAVEGLKMQLFRTRVETRGLHKELRDEALAFHGRRIALYEGNMQS